MLTDYAFVAFFIFFGIAFVGIAIGSAFFVRPQRPGKVKLSTYECGVPTIGTSWVRFNVRFYLIALAFVVFDVEAAFLLPWAVAADRLGLYAFIEMVVFIVILMFALAYAWRKKGLQWV